MAKRDVCKEEDTRDDSFDEYYKDFYEIESYEDDTCYRDVDGNPILWEEWVR